MQLVYFQRKPRATGNYSIERVFETVREHLPETIDARVQISRFESSGILRRLFDALAAKFRQADINHVTGDVHFLACFLDRKKTVLTVHDCGLLNESKGIAKYLYKKWFFEIPARHAACITVVSEATRDELLTHIDYSQSQIRHIPVGLPVQYTPDRKPFNHQRPVILQVGVTPNKNLEGLARALAGLACRLYVVGELDAAQQKMLDHEAIDYMSYHALSDTQMLTLYRACDLVCFASTYEGFGMPIIEANAVGRPVITSNVSSMPEVAGDAACLVDPFDQQSIRQGVLRVIEDEEYRNQLIESGFENVKRFDPQRITDMYVQLYDEILSA